MGTWHYICNICGQSSTYYRDRQ